MNSIDPRHRGEPDEARLRITEIFYSLQGESNTMGFPTVFVRLTGCPLRCGYCDTAYAFKGGEWLSRAEVLKRVMDLGAHHVTVTGGEPLAQQASLVLMSDLCDAGHLVSLETSGTLDISAVDSRVLRVVDIKTPGSGEENKNFYRNIDYLNQKDQVKFVICSEQDYLWVREIIRKYALTTRCEVLMSPAKGLQNGTALAEWILGDHLRVRFQIQLHKYLWGDTPGK
ncbi:MAG: 7-carboxy-7-deazaguanine synthase QueE [Gammaproteobacteria bacterium]|nr:7-carboxy-7-deazaguanine synthase QueE [Gammaproteobacteria bacterium]